MTDPAPPSEAEPLLVTRGLEVRYDGGTQAAVAGLDLTVPPGGGVVLAGPSGSGKTTALRGMLGLENATGEVSVLGAPAGDPAALARVGYAPQERPAGAGLRVGELVGAVAGLRGAPSGEAATALRRAGLPAGVARRRVERLDVEESRRVALACAIAGAPMLLVLDDPWEFPETMRQIADARARGGGVLVATDDPAGFPRAVGPVVRLTADGRPA